MAMPLRLARFVASKLGALPLTAPVWSCRLSSRDARVSMGQSHRQTEAHHRQRRGNEMFEEDHDEEDHDMDDVDDKLQTIITEEKKRQRAAKFHQIRRQLSASGAPGRKLSWDAIEQIRYLKQESPEEWTVERLAEGFAVSQDVIFRVLRSKFTPTPERKLQQDTKVLARTGHLSLADGKAGQPRQQLPSTRTPAMLPTGSAGALVTLASQSLAAKEDGVRRVPSAGSSTSVSPMSSQLSTTGGFQQYAVQEQPACEEWQGTAEEKDEEDPEKEEEQLWDGSVFSDRELEDFARTLSEKPGPVEQRGREFFDGEGNFLYRV